MGAPPTTDRVQITQSAKLFLSPPAISEIRVPGSSRGTWSGYFDDPTALTDAVVSIDGRAPGIYVTLNPVRPNLLARAVNRLNPYAKQTTTDSDIIARCWLPLDFDPKRPAGISSTHEEHDVALSTALRCRDWLCQRGWPEPIYADSGNGAHLLFRIDLPNDADANNLVRKCLEVVGLQFSSECVDVDQTVHNAGRIWKLYGTKACKGDSTEDRPHRRAQILDRPNELIVVPQDLLKELAASAPTTNTPSSPRRSRKFDLDAWISTHTLPVVATHAWQGGKKWILNPCPWNPDHTNRAAYIVELPSGAIAAGCHHNGCRGNDWRSLRDHYEPGSDSKKTVIRKLGVGSGVIRVG